MTERTVEVAEKIRVEAFFGGVQATSLALMAVLKRKVAVGLLDDKLAQSILENTGTYLEEAIEELPEDDNVQDT